MKLRVYKGFDIDFLKKLDLKEALIPTDIENKINILEFDNKLKKRLDSSLTLLEDFDSKWVTYEEYSLIHSQVSLNIKEYDLEVEFIINNIFADVYPIYFKFNEETFIELNNIESNEKRNDKNESETIKKILMIFSHIYKIDDEFYGTYYNYEFELNNKVKIKFYYNDNIKVIKEKIGSEHVVYINDNLECYLKDLNIIIKEKPNIISISNSGTRISNRIEKSLHAFCLKNNIKVTAYHESLKKEDTFFDEFIDIAKNDLKIPNFTSFRNIKFYKTPDLNNEIIEISQAQIIKEIVTNAEKSYEIDNDYRDIFITASTGAGKSIMFQIPAVYLSKKYKKLTIIIEPVIALMEDQKNALKERGFSKVATFNSNLISQVERDFVLQNIKNGEIDLLYLSPETLLSYSLETIIGDRDLGLLIVDEAHIVTTWGVGFRPDYWYLGTYINNLRKGYISGRLNKNKKVQHFPICAFTATAINGGCDDSISETIISLNMENPLKFIGYAKRDNISFEINIKEKEKIGMSEYEEKKGIDLDLRSRHWLQNKEKTIVYFPYAQTADDAYKKVKGFAGATYSSNEVGLYTGKNVDSIEVQTFKNNKQNNFDKFKSGEYILMFATKAFGMGVDINDIKNVYHYAVTGNLCDYVQEIGRVARKQKMNGYAITDFYVNDLIFIKKLFGMSQIRQYEINKVLSNVYDVYESKNNRNFLISPLSFTYIFNGKEDVSINKLKTCLLMLEKDLYDKYNFKVLISRPRSVFTKAFVCIDSEYSDYVLKSKYGRFFKFVSNGRDHSLIPGTNNVLISDCGDIYSIDLKQLWETYYSNLSFPQFKYYYFSSQKGNINISNNEVEILNEIRNHIYARQKVTIKVKYGKTFSEINKLIIDDLNYIVKILNTNFRRKYFTIDEFINSISEKFSKEKSRIIANSIFDLVDPNNKVVKSRNTDDMNKISYTLSNGNFETYLFKSIYKSNLIKSFKNNDNNEYSQFTSISSNNMDLVALKIFSIFDYLNYEIIGGEQPEIFIRLNDPNKIKGIVTGAIKYSNDYVTQAKEKHDRDVRILEKFFLELKSDEERWDYIENYFLGNDVLNEIN